MKNKGFTLIELLAVIVILAIIALIATPVILNIIDDSREESYKISADNYAKAITLAIARYELNYKKTISGAFELEILENGNKNPKKLINKENSDKFLTIEYDGVDVLCNTINISETGSLYMAGCSVGGTELEDYEYGEKSLICKLKTGTTLTKGSAYNCTVSEGKTYKFYLLSANDENGNLITELDLTTSYVSYNLIMSANITPDGIPITNASLATTDVEIPWNTSGKISDGPVTVMQYLNNATLNWVVPNLNQTYVDSSYTINLTGKARLPYYQELSNLNFGSGNEFLYDNLVWWNWDPEPNEYCPSSSSEKFDENYIGNDYNCIGEADVSVDGYWTLTTEYDYNTFAYQPQYLYESIAVGNGFLPTSPGSSFSVSGVRPVITIPSDKLN